MRRRLVLLSLATTVLVVVAFVLPLGMLVRRQAVESAKVGAERDAQWVASLVALAVAADGDPAAMSATIGELPEGTVVYIGDQVLGELREGQGSLAEPAAETTRTVAGDVPGGWEVALPVVVSSGVVVVDSFVSSAELTAGVGTAWLLLALLALVLVGVAVWVADRMGRSLTSPIEDLAASAHQLAEGDLTVRVEPGEPEEIRETGEAFNYLAGRLDQLLAEERESVAELSHRLRTPLTSLRLQAEALGNREERAAMSGQVDRFEHALNQVIDLTRSRAAREPAECRLNEVVSDRCSFWTVLAEEQGRDMSVRLGEFDDRVRLGEEDLGVAVDTLIGNVFAHTPAGVEFEVRTGVQESGEPWLEIADRGPGFVGRSHVERGVSGSGSTGLGLDIVARTAHSVGGDLQTDDRPGGGAVVRMLLG